MDFFEHQEQARKNSGRLIVLFGLAVLAIVGSVYLAVMLAIGLESGAQLGLWHPRAFGWIASGVLLLVAAGSLWKSAQLRGGGAVVARRLDGRRIEPSTSDLLERRVLNVVQEMAIASGTPVPDVYVLDDEAGINAFAAGYAEGDTVIGVTQGAMEKLTRDELQGVLGHEFSHALNGDMRLNLRLMAVLHGILLLGILGRGLMYGGGRRHGHRGKGGGQVALLGLALLVIGYLGVFFGNLIKAAVSRQREFLADASAVQFTRNPGGIAGALAKIGGLASGSLVRAPLADEASHMFFGDGMAHRISSALATHPPLTTRIRRIDPSFTGRFAVVPEEFVASPAEDAPAPALAGATAFTGGAGTAATPGPRAPAPAAVPVVPPPAHTRGFSALDRIGRPGPEHLERARTLWASVPAPLREAARHPDGAVALSYALLLAPADPERDRQRAVLRDADAAAAADALVPAAAALDPDARLPLLEVAAAALGSLSRERFTDFSRTVRDLVEGDREVELSEWILSRLLLRHLRDRLEPARPPKPRYRSVGAFTDEAVLLLSTLAHAGHGDERGAERAFASAAAEVGLAGARVRLQTTCPPRALEAALETFALLFPEEKRRLVSACAASVAADARITAHEAELFRVVADWLGAPVPPLLPGQPLS